MKQQFLLEMGDGSRETIDLDTSVGERNAVSTYCKPLYEQSAKFALSRMETNQSLVMVANTHGLLI